MLGLKYPFLINTIMSYKLAAAMPTCMEQQRLSHSCSKTESFTLEDVPSPKLDLSGVNLKLKGPPSHDITRKYTSGRGEGNVSRKEVSHLLSDAVIIILTEATWERGASFGTKCIVVGKSQHWALETTGVYCQETESHKLNSFFLLFPALQIPSQWMVPSIVGGSSRLS